MATKNFFDLLGDNENEDPSQVVVWTDSIPTEGKSATGVVKKPSNPFKLPMKPAPPSEVVKYGQRGQYDDTRGGRGGSRGARGGRGNYGDRDGFGREAGGHKERNYNNDRSTGEYRDADGFIGARSSILEKPVRTESGVDQLNESGRGGGRGRIRGGHGYGGEERTRRREFDRHSGNGRGNEAEKRAGAGRGNWGTEVDPIVIQETVGVVKEEGVFTVEGDAAMKPEQESFADGTAQEVAVEPVKEEEEEETEMTLEEYEKVLEEKRKALEAEKASERKVEVDKAFEKMHLVDNKKREEDIFIKLGQDKEKVKRDSVEREEKSRKPVSINEFLKPADGDNYIGPSNRGRGGRGARGDRREGGGRGDRDSIRGSYDRGRFGGSRVSAGGASVPKIEDQAQFPTLGGK